MCSLFSQRMEKDQGDLADIVRASGGGSGGTNHHLDQVDWRIPSQPLNFSSGIDAPTDNFGDPFSTMHDPLLYEHDIASTGFFDNSNSSSGLVNMNIEEGSSNHLSAQTILDEEMRRPCNIFSRMLQISPNNSKIPISSSAVMTTKTCPLVANDMVKGHSSTGCPVIDGGMQISSPRNPAIKRRKSQAKKVVCIPAPAAANSRPSGEIVPSDLWAWRKYGQKPIKGSPYPRGYYRCSSSKGCSARKQVERSRTDPNMLVITYTSEHNHPWPTQRNALAGSTRSQPTKNNVSSKSSQSSQTPKPTNLKEEYNENNNDNVSSDVIVSGPMMTGCSSIKEEMGNTEKAIDMYDGEFHEGFNQSYRPTPADTNHSDDFFADLGELEPDPLNLLFSQGFSGEKAEEERNNKALLDPFSLFDWTGNNSFGETGFRNQWAQKYDLQRRAVEGLQLAMKHPGAQD